jgi:hypothetical protein
MSHIASVMNRVPPESDGRPPRSMQSPAISVAVAGSYAMTAIAVVALIAVLVTREPTHAADTAVQPAAQVRHVSVPAQPDAQLHRKLDHLIELVQALVAQSHEPPQPDTAAPHRARFKVRGDRQIASFRKQIESLTHQLADGSAYAKEMEKILVNADMQMHTPADAQHQPEHPQRGVKP